jgi:hypothetical protein
MLPNPPPQGADADDARKLAGAAAGIQENFIGMGQRNATSPLYELIYDRLQHSIALPREKCGDTVYETIGWSNTP